MNGLLFGVGYYKIRPYFYIIDVTIIKNDVNFFIVSRQD